MPIKDHVESSDDDDDDEDKNTSTGGVTQSRNHVYFYAAVSVETQLLFTNCLSTATRWYKKHNKSTDLSKGNVFIHIHSEGGDIFCGLAMYDLICNCEIATVAIVEGVAYSAITFILLGATKAYMTASSFLLLHGAVTDFSHANDKKLWDEVETHRLVTEKISRIYYKHTSLSHKEISELLTNDAVWTAEMCLKKRIINGVWNPRKYL